MRSALFRARSSARVQVQLTRIRKLRDRWVDHPLRQIEQARRQLLEGDVDVLILGDSSTLCWSVHDTDRTLLPELIGQRLGPKVVNVAGPGYGAYIHAHALRILGTLEQRPKVVVSSMPIRANAGTHIMMHPTGGYPRSLEVLPRVTSARHRIRAFGRGGQLMTDEAAAAYRALPVESHWAGPVTIGHYRERLEGLGRPPWPLELEKLRFDFFHGEYIRPDDARLQYLTDLGREIDAYGVPTVMYWCRPPRQRGEMHFPDFESHVRANLAVAEKALYAETATLGPLLDIDFEDDEYEDSQNATEHFSYAGRVRLADAIAERVQSLTQESR